MKRVLIFVVLAMVVIGFCAAQSSSNGEQRIVGTWTQESGGSDNGVVWIFYANGTGTKGGVGFYYGISAGGFLFFRFGTGDNEAVQLFFSPDGRKMLLSGGIVLNKR
jgi:hypothetical protein